MTREELKRKLEEKTRDVIRATVDLYADEIEEACDGAEVITVKDGTLKMVYGRFVIYDRDFLKSHFNTTEAKIYGAEPCEDCVSRQAVAELARASEWFDSDGGCNDFLCELYALPSVKPSSTNPSCSTTDSSTEASTDCISRQAVLDTIDGEAWGFCDTMNPEEYKKHICIFSDNLRDRVNELPSVKPKEKTDKETEEEKNRRLCRMNYEAQLESMGYDADGNPK